MKTVELRKATEPLASYLGEVRKGPLVLTVKGDAVAALVSVTNADLETLSLSRNPKFLRIIQRSRKIWKKRGGLSEAEVRLRLSPKKGARRKS